PPPGVSFAYYYDNSGIVPNLSVRVTNSNPAQNAIDLSLLSSTNKPINLARIDTPGAAAGGVHDVSIAGRLVNQVGSGAPTFPGPATAKGGVVLSQDKLGAVGIRDNVPAGAVSAASIQAVSFGSVTEGSTVVPGSQASAQDAAALLGPQT